MLLKAIRIMVRMVIIIVGVGLVLLVVPRLLTALHALPRRYSIDSAPEKPVAIVFGAGLWRDGTPTSVLRDRIEVAAQLYFSGKVKKILMSGDNRFVDYNEPGAMGAYAAELGVPEDAIVLDYAGRRTYDTCYRAKAIFGLRDTILVTQSFHLPRALYTCNALGLNAIGVSSDKRDYRLSSKVYWQLRELPATLTALLDVHIFKPEPVLGDPLPIFPESGQ